MHPKILVFPQTVELYQTLAQSWFQIAEDSIRQKGMFAVAICGGKTPRLFYRHLSKYGKPHLWRHTHIFITDERLVGMSHKENNGNMIKKNLLKRIKIPPENVHFVDTDQKTVRSAAQKYENELKAFFCLKNGSLPKFDLILLGIGEDGHTASLFPSSRALKDKKQAVIFTLNPARTQWRISLSLPAINNARNVFFLVIGTEKAQIIKKIFSDKKSRLPAALVDPKRGQVKLFLDDTAAILLNS